MMEKKEQDYNLLIVRIESYLKSYKDVLIDSQESLINYQKAGIDELVQLKIEHCEFYKGKIEVLTDLLKTT